MVKHFVELLEFFQLTMPLSKQFQNSDVINMNGAANICVQGYFRNVCQKTSYCTAQPLTIVFQDYKLLISNINFVLAEQHYLDSRTEQRCTGQKITSSGASRVIYYG